MTAPGGSGWVERVATAEGADLLGFLARRLSTPYEEGPRLDDRRGEGAEDVFVEMAKGDEVFRDRLDQIIAEHFRDAASSPTDSAARPIVRGLLEIAGTLSLTGCASALRAWLARHEAALRADPDAILGRAVLGALATLPGTADGRDFWLRWWRNAPVAWQPRAFMGLRLHDPGAAVSEIPELLRRAEGQRPGARPLLMGMWKQAEGRTALLGWLRATQEDEAADRVRRALRDLVAPEEQSLLGKPKPRRKLPSLARNANTSPSWGLSP
jgi:hypothetical protein